MKQYLFILSTFLFFCSACSSNEDEPIIDFSVSVETGEVEFVQANTALFNYTVSSSNAKISNAGIALYQDGVLVNEYIASPLSMSGQIQVSDLSPMTTYSYKAFAEYTNPNNNQSETKFGASKTFSTEPKSILLKQPSFSVEGGYSISSYRTGDCSLSITPNFGPVGKMVLEVSSLSDFSEIYFSKNINSSSSNSDIQFELPQGKYFCRVKSLNDENLCSNVEIVRVITRRGTIIEDGYVDLGLESLWATKFYSVDGDTKTKYLFPAATIKSFEGLMNEGQSFSGSQYDYLTDKLGKPYRMPSLLDFHLLKHCCMWEREDDCFIISGCTGNAIRLKFHSDDYIDGWAYGYQLYSNYVATSSLYTVKAVWSYHLTTPNDVVDFTYWPYNSIDRGFLLWPLKDID